MSDNLARFLRRDLRHGRNLVFFATEWAGCKNAQGLSLRVHFSLNKNLVVPLNRLVALKVCVSSSPLCQGIVVDSIASLLIPYLSRLI